MILVDALYINDGGGKILLDCLIKELEKTDKTIFYLIDSRNKSVFNHIKNSNKIIYLEAGIIKRHLFYRKNHLNFTKVFCFGNIPPTTKLDCDVLCYFHNFNFLQIPLEFSLLQKTKHKFKFMFIKYFAKNVSCWFVQSSLVKQKLQSKIDCPHDTIKLLPFYDEFSTNIKSNVTRKLDNYIYVSNGLPHKNHKRLIDAFCRFYDKHNVGKLTLTVDDSFTDLNGIIKIKQEVGYPIVNMIFSDRVSLQKAYLASNFLIFPSVSETFGLGLIEALQNGCNIIGADLPYTYEICLPSLVFDPKSTDSIFEVFEKSIYGITEVSKPKIKNRLTELVNLIVE